MSNGDNSNDKNEEKTEGADKKTEGADKKLESTKKVLGKIISASLELKDSRPKVFYGGLGGIVILILVFMGMGNGDGIISTSGPAINNLIVGKTYVLRTPNTYDENATIRLVGAPALEGYDDTEQEDRTGCKHLPQGTRVILKELTDFAGKKNAFAKVTVEAGECQGQSNWTSSINVHEK